MKKVLSALVLVVAIPLFLGAIIGGVGYLAYRDNRARCGTPMSATRISQLGLALAPGFEACDERAGSANPFRADAEFRVVLRPSFACVASRGMVDCATVTSAGLQFVSAMAQAGWGTGRVDRMGEGDSASVMYEFHRTEGHARLNLRRSRWGEVSGDLRVTQLSMPAGSM